MIKMTLEIADNKTKRRDKLVIMMEIVSIAQKGTTKTHIMFRANLSFSQLNEYIGFLLKHNLLEKTISNGKTQYRATVKGLEFVDKQYQVIDMFSGNRFNDQKIPVAFKYGLVQFS
jgi:predicted transcriptional regulator